MQELSNKAQQALGLILISEASMANKLTNTPKSKLSKGNSKTVNRDKNKANNKDPKAQFAPVTFSEEGGVRFLHFGTWWVQGAMRINKPDFIELEYAQQMMAGLLFLDPNDKRLNQINKKSNKKSHNQPFHMVQLGLGTGALTKFAHKSFPKAKVTAIDLNPAVIVAARVMFQLPPPNKNLEIIQGDALKYVTTQKNSESIDLLQVDLYDATARGPALSSPEFYQGCYDSLKSPGVMTVNLFGNHKSFKTNIKNICNAFNNRVLVFQQVHDCNVVVLAFKGPHLEVNWKEVKARAEYLEKKYKLPTKAWVPGLRSENARQEFKLSI
jgi:spermidine synthase